MLQQCWNNGRESSASRYRSRYFWPRLFVPTTTIDSVHGSAVLPWFIVAEYRVLSNDIRLRFGPTSPSLMQIAVAEAHGKKLRCPCPLSKTGRPRDDYQRVWPGLRLTPRFVTPSEYRASYFHLNLPC